MTTMPSLPPYRSRVRGLLFAAAALGLAACAQTPEQIAAAQHAQCVEYGYGPGTPEYGQCRIMLVQLAQQQEAIDNAAWAAAAANMNAWTAIQQSANTPAVGSAGSPLYVKPCRQGGYVYC